MAARKIEPAEHAGALRKAKKIEKLATDLEAHEEESLGKKPRAKKWYDRQ